MRWQVAAWGASACAMLLSTNAEAVQPLGAWTCTVGSERSQTMYFLDGTVIAYCEVPRQDVAIFTLGRYVIDGDRMTEHLTIDRFLRNGWPARRVGRTPQPLPSGP